MENLVLKMAKALSGSENVSVSVKEEADKKVYLLKVDEADIGRIIGRQGKTINAMRTIIRCASPLETKRIFLDIEE